VEVGLNQAIRVVSTIFGVISVYRIACFDIEEYGQGRGSDWDSKNRRKIAVFGWFSKCE